MTPEHGTATRYKNHSCRCDACRKAWADYYREYQHRTGRRIPRAQWVSEVAPTRRKHGVGRYRAGCRCDICRAASAAQKRRQRAHKRERERANPSVRPLLVPTLSPESDHARPDSDQ